MYSLCFLLLLPLPSLGFCAGWCLRLKELLCLRHPISAIGVTAEIAEKSEEQVLSVHRRQFWALLLCWLFNWKSCAVPHCLPVLCSRADESSTQRGFEAAENTLTAAASSTEVNSNCRSERKSLWLWVTFFVGTSSQNSYFSTGFDRWFLGYYSFRKWDTSKEGD